MTDDKNIKNSRKDDSAVNVVIKRNIKKKKVRAALIRNTAITVICIALGIIISVQYKSLSASGNLSGSETDTIVSLQTQYMKLEQENESLITANEELQNKVELLESATNQEQIDNLEEELMKIQMFAGTTAVTGNGLYISITMKDDMLSATLQRHLLTLINELKASTAQAIAVNGERITAMTEIRVVGQYVVINGRQHQAPFEIYAIGQPQDMLSGIFLNGAGPLASLMNEKACEVTYTTVNSIVINACEPQDIVTNLLKNAE